MTTQVQEAWLTTASGKSFNPDNYAGLQCKDVADAYCLALWGDWVHTIRPGDGATVFDNANPDYFTKIRQNWNDPKLIPQRGDIINWGPSKAVPEGHVAVVLNATNDYVIVVQQDGYMQKPATTVPLGYVLPNGAKCIGWIRPKLKPDKPEEKPIMLDEAGASVLYRFYLGSGITDYGWKHRIGKQTFAQAQSEIIASNEYKQYVKRFADTQAGAVNNLPEAMRFVVKLPEQIN